MKTIARVGLIATFLLPSMKGFEGVGAMALLDLLNDSNLDG
jgi:hypothetical protein